MSKTTTQLCYFATKGAEGFFIYIYIYILHLLDLFYLLESDGLYKNFVFIPHFIQKKENEVYIHVPKVCIDHLYLIETLQ